MNMKGCEDCDQRSPATGTPAKLQGTTGGEGKHRDRGFQCVGCREREADRLTVHAVRADGPNDDCRCKREMTRRHRNTAAVTRPRQMVTGAAIRIGKIFFDCDSGPDRAVLAFCLTREESALCSMGLSSVNRPRSFRDQWASTCHSDPG